MAKKVTGHNSDGQIQLALQNALSKVEPEIMDYLFKWELVSITGEKGGIAGLNNISVTIEIKE